MATDWKKAFLAALAQVPVLTHACKLVGIDRSTVFRRRQEDAEFAAAVDEALEEGVDRAERELYRRAVEGYNEPVVHKGQLQYLHEPYTRETDLGPVTDYRVVRDAAGQPVPLTILKHSDYLMGLYVKGRRKRVYAERTEITGADGGDLKIDNPTARAARVAFLLDQARRRKDEEGDALAGML